MKLSIKQTECAGKLFWIVRDTDHSWLYHGPFEDEMAHAFARLKNSENWKNPLKEARENRKAIITS
jgi:hypothetical protein